MNYYRRTLSISLLSLLAPAGAATAQSPIDEGIDYKVLREPVATSSPGKIEVLEFLWYACPHCYHLEPHVNKWRAGLAADVVFKKVHVAFRGDTHQKIFFNALPEIMKKKKQYVHLPYFFTKQKSVHVITPYR